MEISDKEMNEIASRLLARRKYRSLALPMETLQDLICQGLPLAKNTRELEKLVRQKLHNIVAPYLDSVDYGDASTQLNHIKPGDETTLNQFCHGILAKHASTAERLPIMQDFYRRIFAITGIPTTVLDLACGLNPFALPWMELSPSTIYRAYDLHEPRVALINQFLEYIERPPLAEKRDILVNPPEEDADVAFFFKEAHRFEQRQHGCNHAFWQSLKVRHLVVSLPVANLSGSRSMIDGQRILVERTIKGLPWNVQELVFDSEIVFCLDKGK